MSTSATSSTDTTTTYFTGSSDYASDLNKVISRAVSMASLPLTQMEDSLTALNDQSTELSTLNTDFTALQTAVENIGTALSGSSYTADISDTSAVSATLSDGAAEGVYSIEVDSIGAYATSLTTSSWDSTSSSSSSSSSTGSTYTLTVGSKTYSITPDDNSAATVAAAINSAASSVVSATVVNVGSSSSPDYRISLQATALGATDLELSKDGGSNLQTQQVAGSLAEYKVDNSGVSVTSTSRTVTVADGVKLKLLEADSSNVVSVTVTRSTSALSTALSDFADVYDAIVTELQAQRGSSGGALQGQTIVNTLSSVMSSMSTYSDSSGIGLSDLGLVLGSDGLITYTSTTLMSTDVGNSTGVTSFFGTSDGTGYLKALTDAVDSIMDSSDGSLTDAVSNVADEITALDDKISAKKADISTLTTNLTTQMEKSDSALASLESEYTTVKNLFSAMDTAEQAYS